MLTLTADPLLAEHLDPAELLAVAEAFARNSDGWRHQVRFDGATRFTRLLHADERVDVWLSTWLPGQATGLHDHGGSAASIAVVSGVLAEGRVTRLGRMSRRRLR